MERHTDRHASFVPNQKEGRWFNEGQRPSSPASNESRHATLRLRVVRDAGIGARAAQRHQVKGGRRGGDRSNLWSELYGDGQGPSTAGLRQRIDQGQDLLLQVSV